MSLPSGYTQLDYVQSSGAQYVNIGITGKSGLNVVCDIAFTNNTDVQAVFGAQYNNGQRYSVNCNTSKFEYQFWSTYTTTNVSVNVNQRYSVEANFEYNNGYLKVDGTQATTASGNSGTSTYSWYVFARHNGNNADRYASMKLYSMVIKDGGTTVRNLIPCKNASNVAGLYDDVNGVFYSSETSTPLIAGNPVVPTPDTPTDFRATDIQKTTVTLAWNAVAADGYKVRKGGTAVYTGTATSFTATALTEDTQYTFTVTAYNDAGESAAASITVRTAASTAPPKPTNFHGAYDGQHINLGWNASSGASGYKVYRNGVEISDISDLSYSDRATAFASYLYGVSAYNADGESEQAQTTVSAFPDNPIPYLITDRANEDVVRVKQLLAIGWEDMTQAEQAEFSVSLKGAYNSTDLNRVGYAIQFIANHLAQFDYNVSVSPKTNWTMTDIPTVTQMQKYLADVETLRTALSTVMPVTPSMQNLDYIKANAIEEILRKVETLVFGMVSAFRHCGTLYSNQGGLWL